MIGPRTTDGVTRPPFYRWLICAIALFAMACSATAQSRIAPLPGDDGGTWTLPPEWQELPLESPVTQPGIEVEMLSGDPTGNLQQVQYQENVGYPASIGYAEGQSMTRMQLNPPSNCYRPSRGWGLELMPDGLIYRSYMAGPRESKFQLNHLNERGSGETLWDVTLGGRRGIARWGNCDPARPQGWQLDLEGAAMVRINIDQDRDVDASDFRFGVPLTYGSGNWQYKFGYYHLSSHLGDEFIVRNLGATRVNYVRDAIVFGVSYNPNPCWRLYGEAAYAFFTAGGAEPWEFQMGVEYAKPGPTGIHGTPFFATNGHLREEIGFVGDYTLQVGWLWRGETGSQFRTGFQFLTGKSNFYQWFNQSETQFGFAIWYDY